MPRTALTGTRIRALRTARRLTQADLARAAGISPSYLNLIEHNRRRAGATLTAALADALGVVPETLLEASGEALLTALRDAADSAGALHDDPGAAAAPPPELDRIEDFAGRFPGWAGLVLALRRRAQAQEQAIERLSDRMAHDPNLSAALTEIVSAVTAVQSTAAILAETEDLEAEWRTRFHANIHADSVRLAHAAEALVAWLDDSGQETGLAAPLEELESWLHRRGFHLPELEPDAPEPTDWEALIAVEPDLASQAGQALARDWLARAGADARALPASELTRALSAQLASGQGLDPGALARVLGVGPALVLRRLAALPATPGLPRFGLVLCDGSGTLTFRRPLDGFALPRFGGACPAWPLFQALQQPGRPIRTILETTTRPSRAYLSFALAEPRDPARFSPPFAWEGAMLTTPANPSVLAPGDAGRSPRPVGAGCRVCALADCAARREPSIVLG